MTPGHHVDPHRIPDDIRAAIVGELDAIEHEHDVRVLWAIESGSRAWGFPSPDSDFDARFIYVHRRDWYLSIERGRDVIERPVDEVFDVSGWDLQKALQLLRAGNATLAEWLDSPVVYREVPGFRDDFVGLINAAHRPDRAYWHYRSVSERHEASASAGEDVKIKKWLYALRTCLAAEWAASRGEKPPMRLADLVEGLGIADDMHERIERVVEVKSGVGERSTAVVDPELAAWLRERIRALEALEVPPVEPAPVVAFDELFRRWVG